MKAFIARYKDAQGAVAIIVAGTLPILLLAIFGATTVMHALSQRRTLQAVAQSACNRAVKPQRMTVQDDAKRQMLAEKLFDDLAKNAKFKIKSRTLTTGWLEARIEATALVEVIPGWGDQAAIAIHAREICTGIPPYPTLQDVVLSSNFRTPDGTSIALTKDSNGPGTEKWGMFTSQQVGWDGGSGPGIEIQDWTKGFTVTATTRGTLPAGVSNPYVVELDSSGDPSTLQKSGCGSKPTTQYNANSSMYKNFELHPGTYRFSMWFRARSSDNIDDTNKIAVYLEGTRPQTAKELKLTFNDGDTVWKRRHFDIVVTNYGLYRLHVAAEGCGNGHGGLFNDLKLVYIQRPSPEYNDPSPPAN